MIFRSRWFPLGLAILQTVLFVALMVYNSWRGSRDFPHLVRYVREDLSRPFFEPPECCNGRPTSPEIAEVADLCERTAFFSYDGPAMAMHLPAYAIAALAHAAFSQSGICFEALITQRGRVFVAPLIPILWLFVGCSIRRIAHHRWRPPAQTAISKAAFSLGLAPLPLVLFALIGGVISVFVNPWEALKAPGYAFWFLSIPLLAAERLRMWPFPAKRSEG